MEELESFNEYLDELEEYGLVESQKEFQNRRKRARAKYFAQKKIIPNVLCISWRIRKK